ncbi:hypothetical protein TRIUR3_08725 [Triticum urartu]|nr:hypothetical protein TRIUR3_08725 [Triticum urartu]
MADVSKFGFRDHDFGWGTPVYGGMAEGGIGHMTGDTSFLIAVKNSKGEDGLVVPVCLPSPVMDKFVEEMRRLMHPAVGAVAVPRQLPVIRSPI